jgi:predicted transcriptional regulator
MLEQIAHWNDLSPELRTKLEEKIESLGKTAVFKFHISHENPDPEKYNGALIWPNRYTLDPATFDITDKDEKRKDKSKVKKIGLIDKQDEKGLPTSFFKIKVKSQEHGRLMFDLTSEEDKSRAALLLLHPKMIGGEFADKNKQQVFELVDLNKEASDNRAKRNAKFDALLAARDMTDSQVLEFASAMTWDETEEINLLRDKIEATAEETPDLFLDLKNSKSLEYQSTIKRALDKLIISVNPVDGKFTWTSNEQTITVLGPNSGEKNDVERFAEYLMTGGKNADEAYKKIKSLLK